MWHKWSQRVIHNWFLIQNIEKIMFLKTCITDLFACFLIHQTLLSQSIRDKEIIYQQALNSKEFINFINSSSHFLCNDSLLLSTHNSDSTLQLFYRGILLLKDNENKDCGKVSFSIQPKGKKYVLNILMYRRNYVGKCSFTYSNTLRFFVKKKREKFKLYKFKVDKERTAVAKFL